MSFSSLLVSVLALGAAYTVPSAPTSRSIPGQWIVALKPETAPDLVLYACWASDIHARSSLGRRGGGGVEYTFEFGGFVGYSGSFDEEALAAIRANANTSPPWGLSAISHANPPVSNADYIYDDSAGEGIFAYVFDSGILLEYVDFVGRVALGIDAIGGAVTDRTHGTYVAGTVGGRKYGVAKKTTLIDVQFSWLLVGLDWTARDLEVKNRKGKAVINASLGGGASEMVSAASKAIIDAGIPVVAAAGNANQDANNYSPANLPEAITVAASNSAYRQWFASNCGTAVDLFAPGEAIASAWGTGREDEFVTSGTSMAAPYVAGVVAYLLALEVPRIPAEVKARALELAIRGAVGDLRGSPDVLLYNGNGA